MKSKKIETSLEFMEALQWDKETLKEAQDSLKKWDKRPDSFYVDKLIMRFDKKEREHYRNCVKYWENKLNEKL